MSNPILKPGDPRFKQPSIVDGSGQNRFADADSDEQAAQGGGDMYAATQATSERPFEPRYETTAPSRGVILLVLAIVGLAGAGLGVTSLTGIMLAGWIFPLCAIMASGTACVLAYGHLREMSTGARDDSGRELTLVALVLGMLGLFACIGSVASMIWLGLSLLPNIL